MPLVFLARFSKASLQSSVMPRILFALLVVLFLTPTLPAARLLSFSESTPATRPPQKIWLSDLSADETFLAAKLTAAEQKQIIDQVENTSFDVPDSWEAELRVRRVSLGDSDGLVIRGTKLLCGGTGNCQTWVFRRSAGKWLNISSRSLPSFRDLDSSRRPPGVSRIFW